MLSKLKNRHVFCLGILLALFAVQMLMHMNVDNLIHDDLYFSSKPEECGGILPYLEMRWNTWTSRLIIEGFLAVITHSIWTFRVVDSLLMVLFAYCLCRLADCEKRPEMLIVSSCLVTSIPFAMLRSAGWMATSLNIYWTITCVAVALIPLSDSLWKRKTSTLWKCAAVLMTVYGANQEQMAAVIIGGYAVFGAALLIRDKRIDPIMVVIFAISMAEMILHLTCPGNAARAEVSVGVVNLRDYEQFSIIDQLSIGLTSTTALMFFTYCPMLLACGAVIVATLPVRRRGAAAFILALAPLGLMLFVKLMRGMEGMDILRRFGTYVLQMGPERIQWDGQMEMMFLLIVILGVMALTLYLSIGHRPLAACAVLIFAIGFAGRLALSFSPTVVESGERTMMPLYAAMILCALLCLRDCCEEGKRRWPLVVAGAVVLYVTVSNIMGSFMLAA